MLCLMSSSVGSVPAFNDVGQMSKVRYLRYQSNVQ